MTTVVGKGVKLIYRTLYSRDPLPHEISEGRKNCKHFSFRRADMGYTEHLDVFCRNPKLEEIYKEPFALAGNDFEIMRTICDVCRFREKPAVKG